MIFNSILIANRGEIACRIIKTAKEMGIRSIAVYVDADKDSLFVKQADESIRLEDGGYLDGDQIINAAKMSGAQAIHPGYGFLSENASFARKVKKEKLIWVGPSPNVISVMGDKLKAKELAIKIAKSLDCIGLLAVEMFLKGDEILVNEVAPRPHNSGHFSIEACKSSQFQQHIRSIFNLKLGETKHNGTAIMLNLVGDENHFGDVYYENLDQVFCLNNQLA